MFGHDDEAVQCVATLSPVMEEGFEEKFGIASDLEKCTSLVGDGCYGIGISRRCHGFLRTAYLRG